MLVAACGGGGGGGGLSAKAAIDEELDFICTRAFECKADYPATAPIPHEQLFGANETACKGLLSESFDGAGVQASVDAGRVTYNAADAQVCIDFTEGLSCTDLWGNIFDNTPPNPPECESAFVGNVAPGGTCTTDFDCATDGASCTDGTC